MPRVYFAENKYRENGDIRGMTGLYVEYELSQLSQNYVKNFTRLKISVYLGYYNPRYYDAGSYSGFSGWPVKKGQFIRVQVGDTIQNIEVANDFVANNNRQFIGDKTFDVYHNRDGTMNTSIYLTSGRLNGTIYNDEYSKLNFYTSLTLKPIPRDTVKIASCPTEVDLYSNFAVTSKGPTTEYYVYWTVRYLLYGVTKYLDNVVGYNVTIGTIRSNAETILRQFPNADKITVFIDCVTKESASGQVLGTESREIRVNFSNCEPTFTSLSLIDRNDKVRRYLSNDNKNPKPLLQSASRLFAQFNGVDGRYGSSITSYHISILNTNLSLDSTDGEFPPLQQTGQYTIEPELFTLTQKNIQNPRKRQDSGCFDFFTH